MTNKTAHIIDGKTLASASIAHTKKRIENLAERKITPRLDVVVVGSDPASLLYVNLKKKKADEIGIKARIHALDQTIGLNELIGFIQDLNKSPSTHGILVQMPLPNRSMEGRVMRAIAPEKDVDGLHPMNQGKLLLGESGLIPCTPKGCLHILHKTLGRNLSGLHAVIMGRSSIVGLPVGILLLHENCSVTYVHSKSNNPQELTRQADILITATGKANLVNESWIKPGACVIDVGISRQSKGLIGDIDFESVKNVAGFLTPVPGGVGPMTIAMLMENTVEAAELALIK